MVKSTDFLANNKGLSPFAYTLMKKYLLFFLGKIEACKGKIGKSGKQNTDTVQ